ncbi:peroxisomal membrane protein 11B-like [Uloborus diversus]|uniref:peroxisomal membrane protein 11B-like n=1 Tax=Uloborus diversus TaxID=327109 RepID=UPI00240A63B7|nr:peroxisomal membrane protein 11B-like [Uloborus diversus]
MDKVIKLNNQTSGRDKLFRLFQYSSKIIWASLENKKKDKDIINKLKTLESSLSTARKLFRFGRSADTLYSALSSLHLDDPHLRFSITFSRINMALYLFSDHIIWLGRTGLLNIDKDKWSKLSYQLWLYYLTMNLYRDIYEISSIVNRWNSGDLNTELQCGKKKPSNSLIYKLNMLCKLLKLRKDLALDSIKNACDVCLPLAQLGYLKISPRAIGVLGTISSLAGILPLLDPSYKMSP